MRFPIGELVSIFREVEFRRDTGALLRYVAFVAVIVVLYAALFQLIMVQVEGQSHSWVTAVYWTLVTMSTLGIGDVTFISDTGRVFTLVVLVSGVLLLLVMLPFTFIRFFYAHWLETQMRLRTPREVPRTIRGHVIITRYDEIAAGLVDRLRPNKTPCYVIESDAAMAGNLLDQGISVLAGNLDSGTTYEKFQVQQARLLLANCDDATNTNIALTVREAFSDVPIVGLVEDEDSTDILELSGCTHVLPLKIRLGEYLANRVSAGVGKADIVGQFRELRIAEVAARGTWLAGQVLRDTKLRTRMGLNVVGVWERGRLLPAFPDTRLTDSSIVVVVGLSEQLVEFDRAVGSQARSEGPVIIIGAGTVGNVALRALKRQGVSVHVVDRNPDVNQLLEGVADQVVIGDANDRKVLEVAGLNDAAAVLLTPNDDAVNVYLTVYCRRLKSSLRIASRITHDRNLEAIYRAGADFALSYVSLGVEAVMSLIEGHDLVVLGEGVDLFEVPVPGSLENKTLMEAAISSRTGLSVVAIDRGGQLVTQLTGSLQLAAGAKLIMLGSIKQRREFTEAFE